MSHAKKAPEAAPSVPHLQWPQPWQRTACVVQQLPARRVAKEEVKEEVKEAKGFNEADVAGGIKAEVGEDSGAEDVAGRQGRRYSMP